MNRYVGNWAISYTSSVELIDYYGLALKPDRISQDTKVLTWLTCEGLRFPLSQFQNVHYFHISSLFRMIFTWILFAKAKWLLFSDKIQISRTKKNWQAATGWKVFTIQLNGVFSILSHIFACFNSSRGVSYRNTVVYHKVEPFFLSSHFDGYEKIIMNVFLCVTIGERVEVYPGIFFSAFFFSSTAESFLALWKGLLSYNSFNLNFCYGSSVLPFSLRFISALLYQFSTLAPAHSRSHPDFTALKLIYYLAHRNISVCVSTCIFSGTQINVYICRCVLNAVTLTHQQNIL